MESPRETPAELWWNFRKALIDGFLARPRFYLAVFAATVMLAGCWEFLR